jgi:phenylacetic acid degradation operon negative regulatory protein
LATGPAAIVQTVNEQLRRRSVGAPAARSVLLTMLGEYVLPASGSAWQETLIGALGTLGHKTHAARQALARSVSAGWLQTEHHGRRSRVHLSPDTAEMLRSGAERIYTFGEPWRWDGRWLLVVLRVPEERREVRHQMRTRLAWAGFGSLGGGLWITPHAEREHELADVAADGSAAEVVSFRAELGALGEPARVVAEAWDLDALADAYRAFITRFSRMRPRGSEAEFRAQTLLVHEWRRFPFLDPDLPDGMLPARWPRRRAHDLFHERHTAWEDGARAWFDRLERGEAPPAGRTAA